MADEILLRRVYFAARQGLARALFLLLSEAEREKLPLYTEATLPEDGHQCSPLIVAALNGHTSIVRLLVDKFSCNVEQEGNVQTDGYLIEGATALWCASSAGHIEVVRFLVSRGADVNHSTKTKSTPLRAACFDGRLDVIRYLVDQGADVQATNNFNNTCLMISAFRGHLDVVSYLLDKKADINAKAYCGETALHFAAEHGHCDIVRKLIESGAQVCKNNMGMSPLLSAAERTKEEVVLFLIKTIQWPEAEITEALELLGASFANDKDLYNIESSYFYLHLAMSRRCSYPEQHKPKKLLPPIPAYNNHIECQTLSELEAIQSNSNALHMESLVVRERILGSNNPEVPQPIIFRGALFADLAQFDKCIDLWFHALTLKQANDVCVSKDILRFAQVFAQMIHLGENIPFQKVRHVLVIITKELIKNKNNLRIASANNRDSLLEELHENLLTTLYMLVIVTKLMKKVSGKEENSIYRLIYQIIKLGLTTNDGSTLLHLAVNAETPVDEFHTKHVCKFPCAATACLLVSCGADVNAVDKSGNTPLHIIVAYHKPITDFMTLHSIINKLLEAGSHIDRANCKGETPFDAVVTSVADIILKSQFKLSLQCLAAKAVRLHNIPYKNVIHSALAQFIDIHGPVKNKS